MSNDHNLIDQTLLKKLLDAIQHRTNVSFFPENPSHTSYGDQAIQDAQSQFNELLNHPFEIKNILPNSAQPHDENITYIGDEKAPFLKKLGISYPHVPLGTLIEQATHAKKSWQHKDFNVWVQTSIDIVKALHGHSHLIGEAVMHTTGQAPIMAFQAGSPHAQERALEAIAIAYDAMSKIPKQATWTKRVSKIAEAVIEKTWKIAPEGISLAIGCATFPTWNSYPGIFASLSCGNPVIIKPHPDAILPLALTVKIARTRLHELGLDPNLIQLAVHAHGSDLPQQLSLNPAIKLIDFTGSKHNGDYLENNAKQARVYTEKSGINQIIIDSTDNFEGLVNNIALSISLFSGQMCTAPQNILIPESGIQSDLGHLSYDAIVLGIKNAVQSLLENEKRATLILGAINNHGVLERLAHAQTLGKTVLSSQAISHPKFKDAIIRTPEIRELSAKDHDIYSQEYFGPIVFIIKTHTPQESLNIAHRTISNHGALTLSVYSTNNGMLAQIDTLAIECHISPSINFTGGILVNQSAAFSDFHGSGGNPAANCSLTDAAFIQGRFKIIQTRRELESKIIDV